MKQPQTAPQFHLRRLYFPLEATATEGKLSPSKVYTRPRATQPQHCFARVPLAFSRCMVPLLFADVFCIVAPTQTSPVKQWQKTVGMLDSLPAAG